MRTVRVRYKSCLFLIGILLISGLVALFALASTGHVWVVSKATQPENIRLQRNADNSTYNPDSDSRDVTSFVHSESFKSHGKKLEWIGDRILRMANTWSKAYAAIKREHPKLFASPKRILVLPGLLTEYSSYNFAENAFKGGYLGELVQWSDLIAGLYLLHGNLTMVTSIKNLQDTYKAVPDLFDLVITDYMGLVALHSSQIFAIYKCKIRIVDSFGTEPMSVFSTYNYSDPDVGETFTVWNFEHFQQFWTYYPHTPDNSFLGTVVEKPAVKKTGRRLNRGLIYGKSAQYLRFLRNFDTYLNTIGQYMELHSTFPRVPPGTPRHIVNHGVIPQSDLQLFLQSSRLFVGLGFPYDGPGAVEAIANGCPFIQPKFNPPFSKDNNAFFKGKPTRRTVTSQHPYLENFVGEPYVYTVDVGNISSVRQALIRILKQGDLEPFIPYDLTAEGFLARLGSMILYQDFCDGEDLALKKPGWSLCSMQSVLTVHCSKCMQ